MLWFLPGSFVDGGRYTQIRLACLLNPELVHTEECIRHFVLKNLPLTKIGGGSVVREAQLIIIQDAVSDFKPQERQVVVPEKRINGGERYMMFLDVEKQITAGTDSKKIR